MRDEALSAQAERIELFVEVTRHAGAHRAALATGHRSSSSATASTTAGAARRGRRHLGRARGRRRSEVADIVLLTADLDVLRRGLEEGWRTFANTLKYIYITTSANFGNMVSMAVATPLLPFLPLTAGQILLKNFLSDLPSMAISADRVDAEAIDYAAWDMRKCCATSSCTAWSARCSPSSPSTAAASVRRRCTAVRQRLVRSVAVDRAGGAADPRTRATARASRRAGAGDADAVPWAWRRRGRVPLMHPVIRVGKSTLTQWWPWSVWCSPTRWPPRSPSAGSSAGRVPCEHHRGHHAASGHRPRARSAHAADVETQPPGRRARVVHPLGAASRARHSTTACARPAGDAQRAPQPAC